MTTPAETAIAIFDQRFNCSQAVFSAFAPQFDLDEKTALKLASPFGGGMARRGEVCGVVTGALLALGLARGTNIPAAKEEIYRLSQEFMQRFEQKHGTVLCRRLIDCDISIPAGYHTATEKGVFTNICPGLVRDAVEIAQELLETT